jgi:hypothetical protein
MISRNLFGKTSNGNGRSVPTAAGRPARDPAAGIGLEAVTRQRYTRAAGRTGLTLRHVLNYGGNVADCSHG